MSKRTHSEYHDPDYPGFSADEADSNKRFRSESIETQASSTTRHHCKEARFYRLQEIITREFDQEISLKEQQLSQIDERLTEARQLMDRLRYAIIAEYYQKQEITLSQTDAKMIRGSQSLFDSRIEPDGPQMPLHPSLKKILGKKPRAIDINDLLRPCPQRTAAQNAKETLRLKTKELKRRQNNRLEQIIRQQGIVIDHSKETGQGPDTIAKLALRGMEGNKKAVEIVKGKLLRSPQKANTPGKTLNPIRMKSNMAKHLVVVGNTSKFIGGEGNAYELQQNAYGQTLTHKWLVYVQAKDASIKLENFVRKVRFFLHPSYRPNDIVDVHTPPYQISRRGWGEFPMRVQLFFHDHLQQKPVQLVHKLILDKTLSGMQTLGAETMVEIWLRVEETTQARNKPNSSPTKLNQNAVNEVTVKVENSRNPRTISFTQNKEELEDNLFEFLNKIDETRTSICADIEKIQPTVVVTEPLASIASPKKKESAVSKTGKDLTMTNTTIAANSRSSCSSDVSNNSAASTKSKKISSPNKFIVPTKRPGAIVTQPGSSIATAPAVLHLENRFERTTTTTTTTIPKTVANIAKQNNSIGIPRNNANHMIIGKGVTQIAQPNRTPPHPPLQPSVVGNGAGKKILQKKLVRLVDDAGKVKYLEMLVVTSSASSGGSGNTTNNALAAKLQTTTSSASSRAVTNTTQSTKSVINPLALKANNSRAAIAAIEGNDSRVAETKPLRPSAKMQTKNVVFQKEGKLYIIDPLQMRLKQEQKKQVSLLKPQVSLLKQQQQQLRDSIASDHDYAPAPKSNNIATTTTIGNSTTSASSIITTSRMTRPSEKTTTREMSPPRVHWGMRLTKVNAMSALERLEEKRTQFEDRITQCKFIDMRTAIEYLLRRLPLVADKESVAAAFPFTCSSREKFTSLPAFKQRALEWLRAKWVGDALRRNQHLEAMHSSGEDSFWSTREIVTFARCHAFTPDIKVSAADVGKLADPSVGGKFSEIVKQELKHEQQQIQYETLTSHRGISQWVDVMWEQLKTHRAFENDMQIIDVDSVDVVNIEEGKAPAGQQSHCNRLNASASATPIAYLPPLKRLETAAHLVTDLCKDIGVELQSDEEISPGVVHPMAQTLLAQSLHIFVEKLLRFSLAHKFDRPENLSSVDAAHQTLTPHDVGRVLAQCSEFDFLSNCRLGVPKGNIETNVQVKEEKI